MPVIGQNLRARFSSDFKLGPVDGPCNPTCTDPLPCLGSEITEPCETVGDDSMFVEGADVSKQRIPESSRQESIIENPFKSTPRRGRSRSELSKLPENAPLVGISPGVGDLCSSQVESSTISTKGGHVPFANSETSMNATLRMVAVNNCCMQKTPGSEIICSKQGDSQSAHGMVARIQPLNNNIDKGICCPKQAPYETRNQLFSLFAC